jgi:hypothetical protein
MRVIKAALSLMQLERAVNQNALLWLFVRKYGFKLDPLFSDETERPSLDSRYRFTEEFDKRMNALVVTQYIPDTLEETRCTKST